jgi:DNA polymerase III subunit beta
VQVSCVQENLAKGLSIVGRAVAARSTLPVLSNVLLATDQSRLKLAATNLEIGVTCWIGAMMEAEGSVTVPGRLLADVVSSLAADQVIGLQTRGATLHLSTKSFDANLRGIAADEFPVIPEVTNQSTCAIAPRELQTGLNQISFAAATDDTRPVLAGVQFVFRGGQLTLAAADGFRLAVRTIELARPLDQDLDIVVPVRAVQELARILGDQGETVEIVVTPNRSQVLFHLASIDLVSRLIEGTFPNVQQIIPSRYTTRVIIDTKEFQNANKIASFIARDSNNIVRIAVNGSEGGNGKSNGTSDTPGSITVGAVADVGDSHSNVDAVVEGETPQITIAFNGKYLGDVLGAIDSNQVTLDLNSPSSPGVLRPVGATNHTHVIMPMHLSRPS